MLDIENKIHILVPSVERTIASIYKVIIFANSKEKIADQYSIVKSIFFADRAHLNKWGRPITYDNYYAMKDGPVPSLTLDLLNYNRKVMHDYGITELPWTSALIPYSHNIKSYSAKPDFLDVEDFLSESDCEALEEGFATVSSLGFKQVRTITHEDPAYIEAWQKVGAKSRSAMKLGLLFDEPNFKQAELIAEHSMYV